MTAPRLFRRLTDHAEPSLARRVLTWLYLSNGVLGAALLIWFIADARLSWSSARGEPLVYALVLGALGVWSVSNLFIGRRLREGSRRGVIAAVLLNVGSSLATLPAPSEAPVAVGVSVLTMMALFAVWRELSPLPAHHA